MTYNPDLGQFCFILFALVQFCYLGSYFSELSQVIFLATLKACIDFKCIKVHVAITILSWRAGWRVMDALLSLARVVFVRTSLISNTSKDCVIHQGQRCLLISCQGVLATITSLCYII